MKFIILLALFSTSSLAGPAQLKRQEECYRVDCNINTGDCQGNLPTCEMGYCITDPINCLYV